MKLPKRNTYINNALKRLCLSRMNNEISSLSMFGVKVANGSVSVYDLTIQYREYGAEPMTRMCILRKNYPHLKISSKEVKWESHGKRKKCNVYRIELPLQEVKSIYKQVK